MKRKFILCILCIFMVLSTVIGASAQVSEKHSQWAQESLMLADEAGILPEFFADGDLTTDITRLDFCRLSYQMLDAKSLIKQTDTKASFTDTDDKAVASLAQAEVIHGRSDTIFAPNDSITREEAAVILTNTAELMGVKKDIALFDTVFSDFDDVSDWAKDSVRKMDSLGIMRGMGENNFSPKSNYTMEQSAITILKLFNLDLNDYAENVYEIIIDGDLSVFYSGDKQWIKNADKSILVYNGPDDDTIDDERSFVFFEKSGKWYFYIHNNKNKIYYENNVCSDIYNAETGNIDYELKADTIDFNNGGGDRIEFADDYYMVTIHYDVGAEPVSHVTNMKLYSYEGEEIASSQYGSYGGGNYLDKDEYPCNNRQIRVDFEKAESPKDKYFVPGENLLMDEPYTTIRRDYYGVLYRENFSYDSAVTLKGYTPVKLMLVDNSDESYAIFNPDGKIIYEDSAKPYVLLYRGKICFGKIDGNTVNLYDIETNEYITSLNWNESEFCDTTEKFIRIFLTENIESECASPNGNYTVKGYNMMLGYPYDNTFIEFLNLEGFGGYTPVCRYVFNESGGSWKYYIYNPDGEVFLESKEKMYLLKRNGKVCYTKADETGKTSDIGVYSLETGEQISTISSSSYKFFYYDGGTRN